MSESPETPPVDNPSDTKEPQRLRGMTPGQRLAAAAVLGPSPEARAAKMFLEEQERLKLLADAPTNGVKRTRKGLKPKRWGGRHSTRLR